MTLIEIAVDNVRIGFTAKVGSRDDEDAYTAGPPENVPFDHGVDVASRTQQKTLTDRCRGHIAVDEAVADYHPRPRPIQEFVSDRDQVTLRGRERSRRENRGMFNCDVYLTQPANPGRAFPLRWPPGSHRTRVLVDRTLSARWEMMTRTFHRGLALFTNV